LSVCELAEAVEMEFGHILAVEASWKEQTMIDTYKFRRSEIRREISDACHELINDTGIAEDVYMSIMMPLEDFLSDHEVRGDDHEDN